MWECTIYCVNYLLILWQLIQFTLVITIIIIKMAFMAINARIANTLFPDVGYTLEDQVRSYYLPLVESTALTLYWSIVEISYFSGIRQTPPETLGASSEIYCSPSNALGNTIQYLIHHNLFTDTSLTPISAFNMTVISNDPIWWPVINSYRIASYLQGSWRASPGLVSVISYLTDFCSCILRCGNIWLGWVW